MPIRIKPKIYQGGEGDIGLKRAEEMDPATGTLTEGDIGISGEIVPFEHEGAQVQDKSKFLELARKLMTIYGYPYSKAIQIAKKIIAGIVPTPEETGDIPEQETSEITREDIQRWLEEGRPEGFPKWEDPGFIRPKPPLHKNETQIPHHLDINPIQTKE